ncbi:hypothetical protein [Geomonas agri]|uniref:hypothetical protein n=1 Tax=Geomonas agri TaxID=2873702 RepID=UPI001CD4C930|nr:hypothetical protein [Geomonas agri]
MEMIDVVLGQIESSSKSKITVRNMAERIKAVLASAMPEDYDEIDLTPDALIDVIRYVRDEVNKPRAFEPNYQLLQEILKYQRKFYLQGTVDDTSLLLTYRSYIIRHSEVYETLREELDKRGEVTFHYELNMALPLHENIDSIKRYCNALEIAVRSQYGIVSTMLDECKGLGPFFIFHEDVIGNEEAWDKRLLYWYACYEAHTLCHVKGLSKAETIRELDASLPNLYRFNLDDMTNATHKLDGYLDEANRLIASAAAGTFPY